MFTKGWQKYKYNQIRLNGWLSMVGELSHKKYPLGMGQGGGAVKKILVKISQNDTEKICMQYEDDLTRFSVTPPGQPDVRGDSNTPSGETPRGKKEKS